MNITIVGPGAMGCLFAALLRESGHNVWLLDRRADRAHTIASRGIFVECDGAERTVPVHATADPTEIAQTDILWIFVKSPDTSGALQSAAALANSAHIVGTFQNGLGNVEQILRYAGESSVVCGTTSQGATSLGWGRVRHAGAGPTIVAPVVDSAAGIARETSDLLTRAGIASTVSTDAESVLWSKLVISSAINPLTAVFGVSNGQLTEKENLRDLMHAAAREAAAVAAARGITLSFADPVAESERICHCTSRNISSMLQDIRHGRLTEIEQITGAVVGAAREAGVEVPTHEMLMNRVRELEKIQDETGRD